MRSCVISVVGSLTLNSKLHTLWKLNHPKDMTQYSIYNQTLHILNPEAEEWSADAFDAVEKHAAVQALHLSFISSLSTAEKTAFIADSTLNLPDSFFEAATAELSKQLNESEAETLLGNFYLQSTSLLKFIVLFLSLHLGIRVLGHNTSLLLAAGGDDRLTLQLDHSTGKVNKYLGSTFVRPGITLRGSCTCSTLTSKVRHPVSIHIEYFIEVGGILIEEYAKECHNAHCSVCAGRGCQWPRPLTDRCSQTCWPECPSVKY